MRSKEKWSDIHKFFFDTSTFGNGCSNLSCFRYAEISALDRDRHACTIKKNDRHEYAPFTSDH